MTQAEIRVLTALSTANGRPVKAETLKERTGFADAELQIVVSSLVSKGWVKWLSGGELSGQPLRFYEAFMTEGLRQPNSGIGAMADRTGAHRARPQRRGSA